jgi:hypothetical protein
MYRLTNVDRSYTLVPTPSKHPRDEIPTEEALAAMSASYNMTTPTLLNTPEQTQGQTVLRGPEDLPDEVLVKILRLVLDGEPVFVMPKANQHFRPQWRILIIALPALRRVAFDPQVILPSPNAIWKFSSAHSVNYLEKATEWLGITQSFSAAYSMNPSTALLEPTISPRLITMRLSGEWAGRGQKELERWHKAIKALPDLVRIEGTWTMTSRQYDSSLNYLTLTEDTINGPNNNRAEIKALSMVQHIAILGDGSVTFKFVLARSA